jgi:hypothetical protein
MINFELTGRAEIGSNQSLWPTEWIAMSVYRFILRTSGSRVEPLGALSMRDDGEAIAFGQAVIRDMLHGTPPQQATSVVEVISGARTIRRIQAD